MLVDLSSTRRLNVRRGDCSARFSHTISDKKGNHTMLGEKRKFSFADVEAQSAFELPDREMMLITVVITNVLNNLSVDVDVSKINIAVQVCAAVNAINTILVGDSLTCQIRH
jgi:hypothetical protein